MDKRYYCRLLGITKEDPTQKEIKEAYQERIFKLNSAEYADDREYARKKIKQAEMAYKVLTGAAPGITKKQREDRFEKLKDAIELREGADVSEEAEYNEERYEENDEKPLKKKASGKFKPRRLDSKPNSSQSGSGGFSNPYADQSMPRSTSRKKIGVIVIIAAVVILIGVTGLITSQVTSHFTEVFSGIPEEDYYSQGETLSEDDIEGIRSADEFCQQLDYYQGLDMSTVQEYSDNADMTEGEGEYGDAAIFDETFNILYNLGINNMPGFFAYITGEEDYYFSYDDRQCAETMIRWMNAPAYEDVAGATDIYTSQPILTLSEYMEYLERMTYEKYESQWSV